MCTNLVQQIAVDGSAKGREGWFPMRQINISYDHPFDAPFEHSLNLDFVNEAQGVGARVAVEMSATAARALADTILAVLEKAEAGGHIVD